LAATVALEGHHDFGVLEARLAGRIRDLQSSDPRGAFAPVAVVAPTRRLLAHLQVRLAASSPGLLNVHFYHHDSLARAAARASGAPPVRVVAPGVREAVIAGLVEEAGGPLSEYLRSRPGGVSALRATFDDLREAGVEAGAARSAGGPSPQGRDLLRLYDGYLARLDDLARRGLADRAGFLRRALPQIEGFARRFRLVIHYGAYELIGANLAVMRRVASSGTPILYLVPFHASSPAFVHARRFWPDFLGASPVPLAQGGTDRLLGERLPCLYDETTVPPRLAPAPVAFFHAQGATAELREVALRILGLHQEEGIPLARVGVVARSLLPYAAMLRPIFEEHGLPFTTSASVPALGEARVQAALNLVRLVQGDYERRPLMDLLRSGLIRLGDRRVDEEAHAWDRLGREWRVADGRETWTRDLPLWVEGWEPPLAPDADAETRERAGAHKEARVRQARALAEAVEALHDAAGPLRSARSWTSWAEGMEGLCDTVLPASAGDPPGAVNAVLAEAWSAMRDLDTFSIPFGRPAAVSFFERVLQEASLPIDALAAGGDPPSRDEGGVRVLDAMQARGLSFDALFLIGLNADAFPRRFADDPFLDEADRRLLRERLSAPLPIASWGRDEEHLLLAHLLGSPTGRLTVSWQRADDDGRARVPSLALREIARATLGAPDLRAVEDAALRVPSHPGDRGREAVGRLGLLPPGEACLNAAFELGSPRLVQDAVGRLPVAAAGPWRETLHAGLAMLRVIDDPGSADLRFDASPGGAAPPGGAAAPDAWSPSRLEHLGACPQHYFFRHLLRVEELLEPSEEYDVEAQEMGRSVHEVLHDVYSGLSGGDPSARLADPERAVRESRALAEAAWARRTRGLRARLSARYPLLWEATSALWQEALHRFLAGDVAALARTGARLLGAELEAPATLSLGAEGAAIQVHGRFDRLVSLEGDDLLVSDYKSSGTIEDHVRLLDFLKGSRLQMPLYILMAEALRERWASPGAAVRAEVLGVGPSFAADESRAEVDGEAFARYREGFLETLRVLVALAAAGHFPLNETSRVCRYCPYLRACRRTHGPTLDRLAAVPAGQEYLLLRGKSTKAPRLEDVRRRSRAQEEA